MKYSSIPMLCSLALVAMCTAGVSHWYSIREFSTAIESHVPLIPLSTPLAPAAQPTQPIQPTPLAADPDRPARPQIGSVNRPLAEVSTQQKEFFEALIKEVKTLRNENLNLVDQMAETNRDLMKLEFRVDTHSESFRPLPTSELRPDTSFQDPGFDDGPGVLPPRAEPVMPFSDE